MGTHSELAERHRRVLPSWLALYYDQPIELVEGKGCFVRDGEGNEYIDFFGGILTTSIGYGVEEFVEAVRSQVGRMVHTSTLYLVRPMVELAERIAGLSGIEDAKVFFTNSGSEAIDTALMMCCAARRSNQVLALRNSYHGRSFAATGVTGNRAWSPSSFTPLSVSWLHNGDRLRGVFAGLDDDQVCRAAAADLREVLATTTSGDVACFIAEPVQGVGGFVVPPDGFFGALQEVLAEQGILYISDEVQTGWGRTGEHFWGYQAHGVRPDLLVFAKGLANGLAIGGVVGRASVVDALGSNSISTFGGNPLATSGALATLDYILDHGLQANALAVGRQVHERLAGAASSSRIVADVRGKGLMLGIELVEPGTLTPSAKLANEVLQRARERGVLVGKGGLYGNVLRVSPPMSVSREVAYEGTSRLLDALSAVGGERASDD